MAAESDDNPNNYFTSFQNDDDIISQDDKRRCHTCTECAAIFSNRMELEEHANSHTGRKPFVCDVCDANFNRRSTLWNHKRIHSDHKPFKCPVCNIEFKWKNSLKCHREMHLRKNDVGSDRFDAQFLRNMSFTHKRNNRTRKTKASKTILSTDDESEIAVDPFFVMSDSESSKNQSLPEDANYCISLPKVRLSPEPESVTYRRYFADGDTYRTETVFDHRISSPAEEHNFSEYQSVEPIPPCTSSSPIVDGFSVKVLPVEQW